MDGKFEFVLNDELIKATVIREPMFEKGDCVVESDGETVKRRDQVAAQMH
jgi:hypothetical protein